MVDDAPIYADATARALFALRERGEVPRSNFGAGAKKRIQPLLDGGVLSEYAIGAGRRVRIERRDAFERWIERNYPAGLVVAARATSRAEAVGQLRDAKRTPRAKTDWVIVRGVSAAPLTHIRDNHELDIQTPTRIAGGVTIELAEGETGWYHPGPIVTVENLEMLPAIEQLIPETGLAIYTRGQPSQRLIDWLVALSGHGVSIIYAGDYDIAGLYQYQRLRYAGIPLTMWIPDDLEELFRDYGNTGLIDAQSDMTERYHLRNDKDPAVRQVMDLIDHHNAGVEQEACLLRI